MCVLIDKAEGIHFRCDHTYLYKCIHVCAKEIICVQINFFFFTVRANKKTDLRKAYAKLKVNWSLNYKWNKCSTHFQVKSVLVWKFSCALLCLIQNFIHFLNYETKSIFRRFKTDDFPQCTLNVINELKGLVGQLLEKRLSIKL